MLNLVHASTAGLASEDKFPFFRDAISPAYTGIEPERPDAVDFDADFTALDLDGTMVARILAPGHLARRSPAATRCHPDDSLFVNFCEDMDYVAEDLLGGSRVPRGLPRLLDNEAGFTVRFPERSRVALHSVRLSRQAMGPALSLPRFNAALAQTPLGQLVAAQFRLLAAAIRLDRPGAVIAVGRSVEALLLAVADEVRDVKTDGPNRNRTSVRYVKDYALARLNDPALAIGSIAAAFSCTPRTIQNHFAADGETFSEWLLNERLMRAHGLLLDPAHSLRSVEAIGFICGFTSATHFHRAFKARFGSPPGVTRRASS
jgi:AraC family transcriptional regulator, positive regulator of tynA and feaB